jgi:hypothetical protein
MMVTVQANKLVLIESASILAYMFNHVQEMLIAL